MRATLLAGLLMTTFAAGCIGPDAAEAQDPSPTTGFARPHRNESSGASEFLRPQWVVGRWWDVEVSVDNGYGFLVDLSGRLVVTRADDTGYRIGSDAESVGVFDEYYDHFHIGEFDPALRASIHDVTTELFRWPLQVGDSWTTQYPLLDLDYAPRGYNVTLTVSPFEDAPDSDRLRIQGETENKHLIDYDYSASTGWMTYFRLVNKTTGRVVLSVDFVETGLDHRGVVHQIRSKVLYERFVISPPWSAEIAGIPPVERLTVPAGLDWVEEIAFLFTYPIAVAGGGVASFAIQRPDLQVDHHVFRHAGDQFGGEFKRIPVRAQHTGDWSIMMQATGTAGVLVSLRGFNDDQVVL